jgi:hypothetical protein
VSRGFSKNFYFFFFAGSQTGGFDIGKRQQSWRKLPRSPTIIND